jgi:hypothetical protein
MPRHDATTSVPIPDVVNASNNSECASLPSMMAALGTPPVTASRQADILGIIPLSKLGSNSVNSFTVMVEIRESVAGQLA